MKETLLSVLRKGTREGQLRASGRGRPNAGGALMAPTGDARMVSEYLCSCLVPFLKGKGLHNATGDTCLHTADEGITSCPDGGKLEYRPRLADTSILWDSAPSHLASNHVHVTHHSSLITHHSSLITHHTDGQATSTSSLLHTHTPHTLTM